MRSRLFFGVVFVSFLLIVLPSVQSIERDMVEDDQVLKVKSFIEKLEDKKDISEEKIIEIFDFLDKQEYDYKEGYLQFFSKLKVFQGDDFFLYMALIHFLWYIYYTSAGEESSASFHLQISILYTILFVLSGMY